MAKNASKIKNIGACLIRVNKVNMSPGESIEVDDASLKSQAFKHLFLSKVVEFEDDPKRTREFISEIVSTTKIKPKKEAKSIEELETGADIK